MPKKKKIVQDTHLEQGKIHGYRFQEDDYANQMAYLFGGEKGEQRAKKIMEEAERQFPDPLQVHLKRKYIEEEVKKKAGEVDTDFHAGIFKIFDTLKNKDSPAKGEEAEKDAIVSLMKGLGLNVDADNVQTHYEPGPPTVFQITWVNRPSENLKDEKSNVNQLAGMYSDCLSKQEKETFDNSWKTHTAHAMSGGPKIEKSEFLKQADQSFAKTLESVKNPSLQMGEHADLEADTESTHRFD